MECPKCKSKNVIKRGKRYNQNRTIQRLGCSDCKYKFIKRYFMYRMRNRRWKVKKAIELRTNGFTFSQIAEQVGEVSRQTIHRWISIWGYKKRKKMIIKRKMKNQFGEYEREFVIPVPIKFKVRRKIK